MKVHTCLNLLGRVQGAHTGQPASPNQFLLFLWTMRIVLSRCAQQVHAQYYLSNAYMR
jgi:hypothetical protein